MHWREDLEFSVVYCPWRQYTLKHSISWWFIVFCLALEQVCLSKICVRCLIFKWERRTGYLCQWHMSTFNWTHDIDLKCILNLQVLKLVSGFYIGLHGACIYDVVGLKNIARGYAIICCAIGLSNIASLSAAGKLNLKEYNIWRISDQNDRSFSCPIIYKGTIILFIGTKTWYNKVHSLIGNQYLAIIASSESPHIYSHSYTIFKNRRHCTILIISFSGAGLHFMCFWILRLYLHWSLSDVGRLLILDDEHYQWERTLNINYALNGSKNINLWIDLMIYFQDTSMT